LENSKAPARAAAFAAATSARIAKLPFRDGERFKKGALLRALLEALAIPEGQLGNARREVDGHRRFGTRLDHATCGGKVCAPSRRRARPGGERREKEDTGEYVRRPSCHRIVSASSPVL
jgi:hypothetical protein